MGDDQWIERWGAPGTGQTHSGMQGILASASDYRIIKAAWRTAQVIGLGPKLLLRSELHIIAEWEPVHFTGKHWRP